MKKNVLRLLKKYDVATIEKSLIQLFLNQHNLKSNNLFLNDYLSSFEMINEDDINNIILKDSELLSFENLERYSQIKSEERKKLIDMQDKLLIDLINKDVKN